MLKYFKNTSDKISNKSMSHGRLFPVILIIIMFLPAFAGSNPKEIKIYLKVFRKRDRLTITSSEGLFLNSDKSRSFERMTLSRSGNKIFFREKFYDRLYIESRPGTETVFTTKYGSKCYDGTFSIEIKKGRFFIINSTTVDSYLKGVVGSELGESFKLETLKAQAVASRTYFFKKRYNQREKGYDAVDAPGRFQAYRGQKYSGAFVSRAVMQTSCEVLESRIPGFVPYFCSTCGGTILTPSEAWQNGDENRNSGFRRYDGSDEYPNCRISPWYRWKAVLPKVKILRALSAEIGRKFNDLTFSFNKRGFLENVILFAGDGKKTDIPGFKFKSCLERQGINSVRSVRLKIIQSGGDFHISGKGFGHLSGMCQWGAEYMARKGLRYREILKFYYPDAYITKMSR